MVEVTTIPKDLGTVTASCRSDQSRWWLKDLSPYAIDLHTAEGIAAAYGKLASAKSGSRPPDAS